MRIYPTAIILRFADGSRAEARLPSGEQTGWKVVVEESAYPDGYLVEADEVTGIKLLLRPAEMFHTNALGWQARPTILSVQYNIVAGEGYADPLVAGVAGLVVSGNLAAFGTPDGAALKREILVRHSVPDPRLDEILGGRVLTMVNLP